MWYNAKKLISRRVWRADSVHSYQIMDNSEIIIFGNQSYEFIWVEGGDAPVEHVSQVSGYVFDKHKNVLIVKNKNWTIPGGHPEQGETYIETLEREVREEACVEMENISYLGCVKVTEVETKEIKYQLRFTATVSHVSDFKEKYETSERLFVNPDNLGEYILWAKGKIFCLEVASAKKKNI